MLLCSHSTPKILSLQGAYHDEHFVTFCFSYENQICPHCFLLFFHHLRQLLLQSLVIKGKNVLSSKIKFRKSYWISNKNNNVTCVIGWFFIILFRFSLSFICTSFMFIVGSYSFDALENLMCYATMANWYKTSKISHFIHNSKGNIILSKRIFILCPKCILKNCYIE